MKNKILHYIGVFTLVIALISSIISPSVTIGSTPKASDDGYEENDDFASAASITLGYHSGLNASDEDWYYFPVTIGDFINIDMYFSDAEGDLDIILYDSSEVPLVGSAGITDEEHITHTASYSGYYYILAYNYDTPSGQFYDLNISAVPPEDDIYEDNDDFASAWEISEGDYYDLAALDDDWFKIWVDNGMELFIVLDYDTGLGLYLYDDSEILITSSTNSDGYENIYLEAHYSGYFYIKVDGLCANYHMEIEIFTPDPTSNFEWTVDPDPYFDYGVNNDEEYIYNVIFDVDFTASNDFYDLLDEFLITQADEDDYVSLSSDFSTKAIINDLEDLAQQDFEFKVFINDIFNEWLNISWGSGFAGIPDLGYIEFPDGGYVIQNYDYFNVSLAIDNGDGWEDPDVMALQLLNDFEDIMSPYFEGEFLTEFQDEMEYLEDELTDPANLRDWDNMLYFERVASVPVYYYQNGTIIPVELLLPEELDLELPFPEFWGAEGIPIFLPSEMNFEDYYNFVNDVLVAEREYCDDNPTYCEWPTELADVFNLADMEAKVGITNVEVQSNAIGVSFNLDEVDTELINLLNFYTNLEEIGVYDFTGTIDYALEFDDDWVLLSMACYIHGGLTLDWDDIDEAPIDFNEEALELDLVFTICQQGFYPPSEDQIKDGEIGVDRNPSSSPFEIPSYPFAVLGIIGLVSVLALVKKHKK